MTAFTPLKATQAKTQALVVGTAASSITLTFAPSSVVPPGLQLMLFVVGTQPVFVSLTGAAVIPTAGTPQEGFWVPAGVRYVITPPSDTTATLSAIATATGSTLYVTQGAGL